MTRLTGSHLDIGSPVARGGSQPSAALPVAAPSQPARWRQAMPWALATVLGATTIGLAVWALRPPASQAGAVTRFPMPLATSEYEVTQVAVV